MSAAPALLLRPATRAELPAVLALPADEDRVVDPATAEVTEAYERAFAAIEVDARNEMLVLVDTADGTVWAACRRRTSPGSASGVSSGR
ncbi:hypothetical protein [Streptomyces sp. NPDC001135]